MMVGTGPVSERMVKAVSAIKDVESVVWVPSGEEALGAYRTLNPDLILMDIIQNSSLTLFSTEREKKMFSCH